MRHRPQQSEGGSPDILPSAFLANHHRLHNPDDPKLRATPATRSKRSSLFSGIIKSKPKGSKLPKAPSTSSGREDDGAGRAAGGRGLALDTSTWSSRAQGGGAVAPRERTSSRSRRHSVGPVLVRSAASLQADAETQELPELPSRFIREQNGAESRSPRTVSHDKVVSGDSRPPSDLLHEGVLMQSHDNDLGSSPPPTSSTVARNEAAVEKAFEESADAATSGTAERAPHFAPAPAPAPAIAIGLAHPASGAYGIPADPLRISTRTPSLPRPDADHSGSSRSAGLPTFTVSPSSDAALVDSGAYPAATSGPADGDVLPQSATASAPSTSASRLLFQVPARTDSNPGTSAGASSSNLASIASLGAASPSAPGSALPSLDRQASPSRLTGPVSIRSLRDSMVPKAAAAPMSSSAGNRHSAFSRAAGGSLGSAVGARSRNDASRMDDEHGENGDDGDDDPDFLPRPKRRAEMSLLDFLSSEPASEDALSTAAAAASPSAPVSMPLLAAAKAAAQSPQPADSLAVQPTPIEGRRRSSGNIVLPSQQLAPAVDRSRRASAIPASASGLSQGLDGEQDLPPSPSRSQPSFLARLDSAEQRRSSTRNINASASAPPSSSSAFGKMRQAEDGAGLRVDPVQRVRGSSPGRQAPTDLGSGVSLAVEPLTDDIVMFGSTQTSSNYSLSGAVVLTIPKPRPRPAPRQPSGEPLGLSRAASIHDPASPTKMRHTHAAHRHTASLASPATAASPSRAGQSSSLLSPGSNLASSALIEEPAQSTFHEGRPVAGPSASPVRITSPDEPPRSASTASQDLAGEAIDGYRPPEARATVKVDSLTVTFSGFAMYVDATGRFNAIKLASVSQELLQSGGCVCEVDAGSDGVSAQPETQGQQQQLHASRSDADQPVKYDIEFDLAVPGWLPGSLRSRFGGTFYCLQAVAVIDGRQVRSGSPFEWAPATAGAASLFSNPFATSSAASAKAGANGRTNSDVFGDGGLSGSAPATLRSTVRSAADPQGSVASSTKSERPKSSWLGKRAKQLQLRTPKKGSSGSGADSSANRGLAPGQIDSDRSAQAELLAIEENGLGKARNEVQADGKRRIESGAITIVIRRCRDVVPVPVARMALIGSDRNLPGLAGPTPALPGGAFQRSATLSSLTALAAAAHGPASAREPSTPSSGSRPPEASLVQSQSSDTFVTAAGGTPSVSPSASGAIPAAAPSLLMPAAQIGPDSSAVPATAATPAGPVGDVGPVRPASRDEEPPMFPPAPSAFDMPSDPTKRAAAAAALTPSASTAMLPQTNVGSLPRSATAASMSSDVGNTRSPPRTSSRGARSSAPMRHFLHRPVLYPPAEFGIFGQGSGSEGLPFSLTLSLPSHVQVSGPKSDTLSFGVQIEVSKSEGWNVVRQLGGLRLRDMELVCLQTERHSSVPSRTFCATFPVPPPPNKVLPSEVPSIAPSPKREAQLSSMPGTEVRLRHGYDRDLVLNHLSLLRQGTAPDPLDNNVERTRTTIVGPPPSPPPQAEDAAHQGEERGSGKGASSSGGKDKEKGKGKGKGKAKSKDRMSTLGDADARRAGSSGPGSGSGTPALPPAPLGAGGDAGPSAAARARASSSSLRAGYAATGGPDEGLAPPLPQLDGRSSPLSSTAAPRSPIEPPTSGGPSAATAAGSSMSRASHLQAAANRLNAAQAQRSGISDGSIVDVADPRDASGQGSQRGPSRGRRAYANALSRLSNFASAMLDPNLDGNPMGDGAEARSAGANGSSHTLGDQGMSEDVGSRATYVFSGEDGDGVDLTRGRVRMTINLPLASSNASVARSKGSAQLIPDFESPYVRIRHKLKVKLGFGLSHRASAEEHNWSQALVMCVPVRFTESPPKEVQDQFAPITVQPLQPSRAGPSTSTSGSPSLLSTSFAPVPSIAAQADAAAVGGVPLLPAYTQLFREDGSRLADEGEDLPQYPGRMSVIGEIDVDERTSAQAAASTHANARAEAAAAPSSSVRGSHGVSTIPEDGSVASGIDRGPVGRERVALRSDTESRQPPDDGRAAGQQPPTTAGLMAAANDADAGGVTASQSYASMFAEALERGGASSVPTPMDRSTSLPGRRGLMRGAASLSPLKSSTSNSYLGPHTAVGGSFQHVSRPPMRQRSATSASIVTFSRIVPSEVLDEALLVNAMEDEEARRDAARVAADGLDDDDDEEEEEDDDDEDGEGADRDDEDGLSLGGGQTDAETVSDARSGSGRSSGDGDGDAARSDGLAASGGAEAFEDDDDDEAGDRTVRFEGAAAAGATA
ncbi:uncharacterized protein PSFLO_07643 [Pseudozyma flocculosa]|nr:uncharacterized protein PSFLO_07643 [Pseudozyma flocculosa]